VSGQYDVTGSHKYPEEGLVPITVTIYDVTGASAVAASGARVNDAPITIIQMTDVVVQVATDINYLPLAYFTDLNPKGKASDFTAEIDWGDGTTTAGVVKTAPSTSVAGPTFSVTGDHTYEPTGDYTATVSIFDKGGSTASASVAVHVIDTTATPVEGIPHIFQVVTFQPPYPIAPEYFTADINWEDGSPLDSNVTIQVSSVKDKFGAQSELDVFGTHTYKEEGSYPQISVTIYGPNGFQETIKGTKYVTVQDAPLAAESGQLTLVAYTGTAQNISLGTFTDANPNATPADYQVTIDWDNGQTSSGTVTANGVTDGRSYFGVEGTHLYSSTGGFPVTIHVTDVGGEQVTYTVNVAVIILSA
jgi:hypothetical protein